MDDKFTTKMRTRRKGGHTNMSAFYHGSVVAPPSGGNPLPKQALLREIVQDLQKPSISPTLLYDKINRYLGDLPINTITSISTIYKEIALRFLQHVDPSISLNSFKRRFPKIYRIIMAAQKNIGPGRRWMDTLHVEVDDPDTTPEKHLYKTKLCKAFQETGRCRYGSSCVFAHGHSQMRRRPRSSGAAAGGGGGGPSTFAVGSDDEEDEDLYFYDPKSSGAAAGGGGPSTYAVGSDDEEDEDLYFHDRSGVAATGADGSGSSTYAVGSDYFQRIIYQTNKPLWDMIKKMKSQEEQETKRRQHLRNYRFSAP